MVSRDQRLPVTVASLAWGRRSASGATHATRDPGLIMLLIQAYSGVTSSHPTAERLKSIIVVPSEHLPNQERPVQFSDGSRAQESRLFVPYA